MHGELERGEIIKNRYEILTVLGQGGMGTTYAALDRENHQRVAIKVVSLRQAKEWKVLELFEREAKLLGTLHHPRIPNYLDYFHQDTESDRRFCLVQELVEGKSLAMLINRGWKLKEKHIQYITTQILEILKYLHLLHPPVVHRDVKPQNIIIRPDGKIYLVDFGAVQTLYRYTLSAGGTFVGTMGYMSPEQLRGKVFPASDVYSLGCTVLFMLTRRSPADLPQKRMRFKFRDRLSISPEFANWLEKMVEPDRENRFASAAEALQALQQQDSRSLATKAKIPIVQKPANTRVEIERSDRALSIKLEQVELEIQPQSFTLRVSHSGKILLGGSTNKITLVDLDKRTIGVTTKFYCAIWEKNNEYKLGKKHIFGLGLQEVEIRWIVAEISSFLEDLRAKDYILENAS